MTMGNDNFRKRDLIVPVFIPSILFSAGEGAILPILPTAAEKLGADLPLAGFIAGIAFLGVVLFDIPAAKLVGMLGERRSMILAALTATVAYIGLEFTESLWFMAIAMMVIGAMSATYGLARHGYLAEHVPFEQRARAFSLMGGMFRGGYLIGPLIGSAVIYVWGVHAVYFVAIVASLLSALVLYRSPSDERADATEIEKISTFKTLYRNRGKLATAGAAVASVSILRTVRQIGLPLWGIYIGMHPGTTSLFIGIAGALDFALFYVSGQIMDRFGRRWALIPTLIGMSLALVALTTVTNQTAFLIVALIFSLANATGSGLVLTLGADLAQAGERNEFLASFRLMNDAGTAATPMVLGALTAAIALPGSILAFAALGLAGAALGYWSLPKYGIR